MRMVRSYLEVSWKPLHKLRLDEITPKHVRDELKNIASSGGLPSADRARAALSVFFVWAIHQDIVAANPTLISRTRAKAAVRASSASRSSYKSGRPAVAIPMGQEPSAPSHSLERAGARHP
jgi:hypothetical protein